MKRGEVWTASGAADYAGKPRPVVIVQDDAFDQTESITICLLSSQDGDAPLARILIEPDGANGLLAPSRLMVDKITSVPRKKLGARIGQLGDEDARRLDRALTVFLGLAAAPALR